ncbi:hypothetical protein SteCoe_9536 [Stentor coeruleus]|uniref:Uncharacterized protein n=1 Tax=Stentor coeruleus TaxID=5963 RepID=A0A1R2CHJ7_9CILI|nr:hypothetical protein SteCoe_9536 [Stentor coeruleus]
MEAKSRKLVIHMDINMTCVMQDLANHYSLEITINKILASQSWGNRIIKDELSYWELTHPQISFLKPAPDLLSYDQYIKSLYKRKFPIEEQDEPKRQLYNNEQKAKYLKNISEFTQIGQPGYKFHALLEQMIDILTIHNPSEELLLENEEHKNYQEKNINSDKMLLIPSFFEMIKKLKDNKRDFAIVFRTFGKELNTVVDEFNMFCKGIHPKYNRKNKRRKIESVKKLKYKDMVIDEQNYGYMSRNISRNLLVLGSLTRLSQNELHNEGNEKKVISVSEGFRNIYSAIQNNLCKRVSLAINDDYFYWHYNGEKGEYGKLLLIDEDDYETQHIFFDDNINFDSPKIVDVRNVVTGESIPFAKCINKYIFKVDSYRAITEPDYFYESILICESNRDEELNSIETNTNPTHIKQNELSIYEIEKNNQNISQNEYP